MSTPIVLSAFLILTFQAFIEVHTLEEQFGHIYCNINDTDKTISVGFWVLKNGSDISVASFIENNNGIITRYDESGCQWAGTGSDTDPFTVNLKVNYDTDGPSAGYERCGMDVVKTGEVYEWLVHAQLEAPYVQEGDTLMKFTCNVSDRLPTVLTWNGTIEEYDPLVEIAPSGGLLSLLIVDNAVNKIKQDRANVGDEIALQLNFQDDNIVRPNTDNSLRTWGAYCERLYAKSSDGLRSEELLDVKTCPRTDFPFLRPNTGFKGSLPNANGLFTAFTGPIIAARFDRPSSNVVTFVCHAKLCWINNDQLCLDSCAKLSSQRKKRTEVVRLLTATLEIADDNDVEQNKQSSPESGISGYIWAIVGVIGAIVLIAAVVITACVLRRMKPKKYKHQHDRFDPYASSTSVYSNQYRY